ncbi:glycosyltransferase [Salinicola endophyticus]|uniref:Glycosyltransferase n=1 Tax=Salinicola endophyticus TaxID=1949083 RepID=A0ABY8FFW5_9GAMM|nr:glycosyltransferase family 4 protein [Salinicola endophyticus]WFF41702.1 glycosyltransferase [Salinicola endophyticus]
MKTLEIVHLVDDVSPGGVMQALAIFEHPAWVGRLRCRVVTVKPDHELAPRLDADVIMTHFPPRWRALPFLASLRLRHRHARLVHIEHSYTRAWAAHHVAHAGRFRMMLNIASRLFDKIVSVSQGQSQWLTEAVGIAPQRVQVVSPWSDVPALQEIPPSDWQGQRPLVVGAYGRFVWLKGFDRLIARFLALDPERYQLRLGGSGPEEQALRALAGDAPHIHFVGQVDDRADFLAACDLIAVPSRWESFGLVATEARQAARPVLVAGVDGLPEQAAKAGWEVDFDSEQGLSTCLHDLTPPGLVAMGLSARASTQSLVDDRLLRWRELLPLD